MQSRIGAHAVRGLDTETTPFCFRHLSPSDLAENACDGNLNAGKVTRPVNSHLSSLIALYRCLPARAIQTFLYFRGLPLWITCESLDNGTVIPCVTRFCG